MIERLKLYFVNMKYVRNLHNADDAVMSVSPQSGKQDRPFIGIITLINGQKYAIPLTSSNKDKFQNKKTTVDCIKVFDLNDKNKNQPPKVIGILNLNNMIPVDKSVITAIDLSIHKNEPQLLKNRKIHLTKELDWCQNHIEMIYSHANRLYDLVTNHPEENRNLTRRCCNFKKLEVVLEKWLRRNGGSSESESANVSADCSNGSSDSDDDVLDLTDDGDFINSSIKR